MQIVCVIKEQLHYNNVHQEVTTSSHFVKIETIFFSNSLDLNMASRPFSDLTSCAVTTRPPSPQRLRQFDYSSHE